MMKKRQYQSGAAHVIAIICLVLALVTALGWIFYQNFLLEKPLQKGVSTSVPTNFEECTKTPGSLLQATYPEVCVTKNGQSFTNPDQKVENPTSDDNSKTAKLDLVITQWGVGADYDDSAAGVLEYKIQNFEDVSTATFTSDKIHKGKTCTYGAAGSIQRYASDYAHIQKSWKKVGEYYYRYNSPQGLCSDDQDSQLAASDAVEEIILNLVEVKD